MISSEEVIEDDTMDEDTEDEDRPKRRTRAKARKQYGAGLPGFPELWNQKGAEVTLRIDSDLLAQAESADPHATRKEAAEELRKIVSTVGRPGEPDCCSE
jgi:type III restriction enzyme